MKKIIVTGINGVGKSHFAAQLSTARPEVPLISFDSIKLTTQWVQKPRAEIEVALAEVLVQPEWILEGGPSLLKQALPFADGVVWIDPPEALRAWQLIKRPWGSLGRTRAELPDGNVDWPWQQYRFAYKSLRNRRKLHSRIAQAFDTAQGLDKWRCRTEADRQAVLQAWA